MEGTTLFDKSNYSPWLYHPSFRRQFSRAKNGVSEGEASSSIHFDTSEVALGTTTQNQCMLSPSMSSLQDDTCSVTDDASVVSNKSDHDKLLAQIRQAETAIFAMSPSRQVNVAAKDLYIEGRQVSPFRKTASNELSTAMNQQRQCPLSALKTVTCNIEKEDDMHMRVRNGAGKRLFDSGSLSNSHVNAPKSTLVLSPCPVHPEKKSFKLLHQHCEHGENKRYKIPLSDSPTAQESAKKSSCLADSDDELTNLFEESPSESSRSALVDRVLLGHDSLHWSQSLSLSSLQSPSPSEHDSGNSFLYSPAQDDQVALTTKLTQSNSDPPGIVHVERTTHERLTKDLPEEIAKTREGRSPPRPTRSASSMSSMGLLSEDEDIVSCMGLDHKFSPKITQGSRVARRSLQSNVVSSSAPCAHVQTQAPNVSPHGTTAGSTLAPGLPMMISLLTSESDDDAQTFASLAAHHKYGIQSNYYTSGDDDAEHSSDDYDEDSHVTSDDEQSALDTMISNNTFHSSTGQARNKWVVKHQTDVSIVSDLQSDDELLPISEHGFGSVTQEANSGLRELVLSGQDSLAGCTLSDDDFDVEKWAESEEEADDDEEDHPAVEKRPSVTDQKDHIISGKVDQTSQGSDVSEANIFMKRRWLLETVKEESRRSLMIANGELPSVRSLAIATERRQEEDVLLVDHNPAKQSDVSSASLDLPLGDAKTSSTASDMLYREVSDSTDDTSRSTDKCDPSAQQAEAQSQSTEPDHKCHSNPFERKGEQQQSHGKRLALVKMASWRLARKQMKQGPSPKRRGGSARNLFNEVHENEEVSGIKPPVCSPRAEKQDDGAGVSRLRHGARMSRSLMLRATKGTMKSISFPWFSQRKINVKN